MGGTGLRGGGGGSQVLKAAVEMSSALLEINSFITVDSHHYHHCMAFLQGIDGAGPHLHPPPLSPSPRTSTTLSHTNAEQQTH